MPDAQALELGDVCSHCGEVAILSCKDRNNWLNSTFDSYSPFNTFKRETKSVIHASNRIINHTSVTGLECHCSQEFFWQQSGELKGKSPPKMPHDSNDLTWCTRLILNYYGKRFAARRLHTICPKFVRIGPHAISCIFRNQTASFLDCKITNGNGP